MNTLLWAHKRTLALLGGLGLLGGGVVVWAQMEPGNRGIPPIGNSSDLIIEGIVVDVTGDSPDEARMNGWQEAQRKAWAALYRQTNGGTSAPSLSDSALNGIVSAIVVQQEQIGLGRYRATLGVQFDRARAGQILGISGRIFRSPPLLVLPVVYEGGVGQSFEQRSEWQRAWAQFRTSESSIDYVRTSGIRADPLLLNAGQQRRRNRHWWREILDQYGASDVLIPSVRVERMWPGGPLVGYFSARYGPDNHLIGNFTLTAQSPAGLRQMMQDGVKRIDALYVAALSDGRLRTDPSLIIEAPVTPADLGAPVSEESALETAPSIDPSLLPTTTPGTATSTGQQAPLTDYSIQVDTPESTTAVSAESNLRSITGVEGANATNVNVGGTSTIRVRYRGDAASLRAAMVAAGYKVSQNGNSFRISR